jgi:hypothetical protein
VLLADDLVERPGPQPGRQGRPAGEPGLGSGVEQVVGHRRRSYGRPRHCGRRTYAATVEPEPEPRRRLVVAVAVGLALLAVLVALQLGS